MNPSTLGEVLAFCWSYWRQSPVTIGLLAVERVITFTAHVILPIYAGQFIDALTTDAPKGSEQWYADYNAAIWALIIFVALNFFSLATRNYSMYVWNHLASRTMRRIVNDSFHKVQRFSTDWHNNTFAGATVRKISRGMWAFDSLGDVFYFGFIPSLLVIVGMTIMLTILWPVMGLFIGLMSAVYIGSSYLLTTRWLAPYNLRSAAADSKIGADLADSITCNSVVKSFGTEEREDILIDNTMSHWRHTALATWDRGVIVSTLQGILSYSMQAGLLTIGLWLWSTGRATPGDVTLVLTTYLLMYSFLREVGTYIRDFQKAANDMDDVVQFSKSETAIVDAVGAPDMVPEGGEVVFDQITFTYAGQEKPLYENFSLRIAPGEQVALVGKSGSGKSTFVKLVQRLHDIDAGAIRIDKQDISQVTQSSLRKAIALVPQEPVLFHRTLAENIAYARPAATKKEIREAARRARADEFIGNLPLGYETLVGERGVKLSGGERQRVAIARAFLADAPILVLDEATSSLDSHTEGLIQEAIEELMLGRTTIVIAHRLSTIQRMQRILVFSEGKIIEQGSHQELLARDGGRYRFLHELQRQALEAS